MNRTLSPPAMQSDHIAPALEWAERNLSSLARLTASGITGGDDDHLHLAAVFGLLRARQSVRAARREVEALRLEARA